MKFNKTFTLKAKVLATTCVGIAMLGPNALAGGPVKYIRAAFHFLLERFALAVEALRGYCVSKVDAADKALVDHLDDELEKARQELADHNGISVHRGADRAAGVAYDEAYDDFETNHKLKQESLQGAVASAITARNAVR